MDEISDIYAHAPPTGHRLNAMCLTRSGDKSPACPSMEPGNPPELRSTQRLALMALGLLLGVVAVWHG